MKQYCGYITIIGETNVGKSTLFNNILEKTSSVTSKRINTTNNSILDIKTVNNYQFIYLDTPGIFIKKKYDSIAIETIKKSDIIILIVQKLYLNKKYHNFFQIIKKINKKNILVINKIDLLKEKSYLLPFMKKISLYKIFHDIIPISAKKNIQIIKLLKIIKKFLPEKNFIFSTSYIDNKKIIINIIKEKIFYYINKEVPYNIDVKIQYIKYKKNIVIIHANIIALNTSYKKILIGQNGQMIKKISFSSRINIIKEIKKEIILKIIVK